MFQRSSAWSVVLRSLIVCGGVLVADAVVADAAGPGSGRRLALRGGTVDTRREANEWESITRSAPAGRRFVIQLAGPMRPDWQARIAAAGITLDEYLPENGYLVRLDHADRHAIRQLEFIVWAGAFRRAWKLDPEFGHRPFVTPERQAQVERGEAIVEVTVFKGDAPDAVVGAIGATPGGIVHRVTDVGGQAVVGATLSKADARALAELESVQFIEDAPELTVRSGTNRWIVQSNVNGVFPVYNAGIHGEGQIIGIIDTLLDRNHCAFSDADPIGPLHRKIEAYNTGFGVGSHGTHVAGICVGDNGLEDNNRGIAYLARLVYNSIPSIPYTETDILARLNLHHGQGARLHTNSWGDDGTTAYNGLARGVDVFSYDNEDDLVLFAVTNTSTLKNPENAKNLLAVGASQDTPNQANFCSGGAGPTIDQRRKPEVYAPGCSTNAALAGSACSTTTSTGTSMACPAVAGAGMLVRQYFTDGYYPTGAVVPGNGFVPSGALIKAVLINSAVDMTGIAGYPSNQEGWGRVLLDNALRFPSDTSKLVVDDLRNIDGLSTGEQRPYVLTVSAGTPLRVTLGWTDPPGALLAGQAWVNDLDLEVVGPTGTLYRGNVFTGGQSSAGGSSDLRNNVEQVLLTAPAAGNYAVWVKATSVVQGPPLSNPFTQGYALVVTGNVVQAPDCNLNGLADAAEIAAGTSPDCQSNLVPDSCDIAGGTSADANANNTPDECDPPPAPAATVTGASSWKQHAVRGPQAMTLNHLGHVQDGNLTSECREDGVTELRVQFDVPLAANVATLANGAVSIDHQRTGDPNAGTAAGYSSAGYAGSISTALSAGSELVLTFSPGLPNAATYRINMGGTLTSIPNQAIEVRGLVGDIDSSAAANATDRSIVIGVWTGAGYSVGTDINLSGGTNGHDRSAVIAAWTGLESTAP